jgi:CMP-N,N'-diacetyllegionaminic acid synthase
VNVLAVIPARGGSKGIPRKNLREVGGRPLIAWTLDLGRAAASAGLVRRAIVSTDDAEIAAVSRAAGADVPFTRPVELADDRAKMAPVLRHAVLAMEAADAVRYDWVLLLQPTSPFRTLDDLRGALRLAEAGGCDSVISVVQVFDVHPVLMKRIEGDRLLPFCVPEPEGTRRQDYDPPAYMRNGAIYLTRRDVLVERGSIWGDVIRPYVMPEERSVSIDTELHIRLVDLMLRER